MTRHEHWSDICRAKNGGMKCDSESACKSCKDAARIVELEAAMATALECLNGEPEYHHQGMGCGIEDRNITDRYDAAKFGWDQAMERVYSEHIVDAREILSALIAKEPREVLPEAPEATS